MNDADRPRIAYKNGYDHKIVKNAILQTQIKPLDDIITSFIFLGADGQMSIMAGYAWDGATGVPDSPDVLRASLFHDALYQLMRDGLLDHMLYRETADKLFRDLCIEDGMPHWVAQGYYEGVRLLALSASEPGPEHDVLYAPPYEPERTDSNIGPG